MVSSVNLLTSGKLRGLQQCATPREIFSILEVGHHNSLRWALNPQHPDGVWQEATEPLPRGRNVFLVTVARERMARVTALCQALARLWTSCRPTMRA